MKQQLALKTFPFTTDLSINWLFGCSAWGTEPNSTQQVWYVGIQ